MNGLNHYWEPQILCMARSTNSFEEGYEGFESL